MDDKAVMNNRNKVALLYGVNRIQIFTPKKTRVGVGGIVNEFNNGYENHC